MKKSFKKMLKENKPLIGTFFSLPSPAVAEILARAGFDWLLVDMEHGTFTIQDIQQIVQAAETYCPCIVRAPSDDDVWIKQILDAGADGILIPHVQSAEQAKRIVRSSKYPPEGTRSVGISKAQGYGLAFQEYIDRANDDIAVVMQVEDTEGVRNIDSILRESGVDAVFIGPYDLSASMGKPGSVKDDDVLEHIETVRAACERAAVPVGIFGVDAEAVKPFIDRGFTLIAAGADILLFAGAAKDTIKKLRS